MYENIKQQIIAIAIESAKRHGDELERKKEEGIDLLKQPDFLWRSLLSSFATWGKTIKEENFPIIFEELSFEILENDLKDEERTERIRQVFSKTKVRPHGRPSKQEQLCKDYNLIKEKGGLLKTTDQLLKQVGKDNKIIFLLDFYGVGEKTARNILMNLYHEDFHESIAIDERIKKISASWGLEFSSDKYKEHEKFYLDIAHEARLTGWELDRLMYGHKDEFINPEAKKTEEVIIKCR